MKVTANIVVPDNTKYCEWPNETCCRFLSNGEFCYNILPKTACCLLFEDRLDCDEDKKPIKCYKCFEACERAKNKHGGNDAWHGLTGE